MKTPPPAGLALAVMLVVVQTALAQTSATSQRSPAKVTTPAGFVRIEVDGRAYLTLPADEAWVRRAAGQIPRPTPATQASDIVDNLRSRRELVVADVARDLPMVSRAKVESALDELEPVLGRIESTRPAMVYVVAPAEHVKQALRDGWTDPHFHYNAASDAIEYTQTVSLQPDGMSDESAVAALFNPGDAESKRVMALSRYVAVTEQQIRNQIAGRAVSAMLDRFRTLVATEALASLPTREDQDWLATGLANVLAARYTAKVHGAPLTDFLQAMVATPPGAVFDASRIDLLHPLAKDQLKDEMVAPYLEAKRRKAVAVMYVWLDRAGEGKIGPLIDAVVKSRPADGASLVAVIKSVTGVDLSDELAPR